MEYRLPDDAVRKFVYQRVIRMAVTFAFMFAVAALVILARGIDYSPTFAAFMTVFYCAVIGRAVFKVRKQAASLSVTLTDDAISMKLPGLLASTVRRDDVTRIEERLAQGLTVHSSDKRIVGVPVVIGGYDGIRAALATWRPIEPAAASPVGLKRTLAVCGVLGGLGATYLIEDPRIVIPLASLIVIFLLGSLVLIWRNKMLDVRYKVLMLFMLMPVLALVARIIEVARR